MRPSLPGDDRTSRRVVYMDNHSTTRVDPRVVEAMLPYFTEKYGNAGSVSHPFGWEARDAVETARQQIARRIGARDKEVVFTSGATESNNLAIRGVALRPRRKGNHIVSVNTEHKSVLEPLQRLARQGHEVTFLDVRPAGHADTGRITPEQVAAAVRNDTVLVSVMLANNEIGVIQPLRQIGAVCKERHVLLHCDATQAVGKIPIDVDRLGIDLMSFTAHKLYGPKGIGALYVRRRKPHVRLEPQITGGGQQRGVRSGTLPVPGIVAFAHALELCCQEMADETSRLIDLRRRLLDGLRSRIPTITLRGPTLAETNLRLAGNLTLSFDGVDGEALLMSIQDLAVSSGAACTSANPEPSHVLRALGMNDDQVRSTLRFGLGRFNTEDEVYFAVTTVARAVERLRAMSGPVR
ncbi:MAG: cysteine desulfurase family protein [Pirellulales bacterium]